MLHKSSASSHLCVIIIVEPDIFISIHGLAPGSFPHFWNPENISDVVDKRVPGSHGSATTSRTLEFYGTRWWIISHT